MSNTIFYSWQSDIDRNINRDFIEDALKIALERLHERFEVQEADRNESSKLKIDKDTKGVPGSPDVVATIFDKIEKCGIFFPDLTFVGEAKKEDEKGKKRQIPNPNVLIEYGWALKAVTRERIIAVMNTAFGSPKDETLPFDMRHFRHPITYCLHPDTPNEEKKKIQDKLAEEIKCDLEIAIDSGILKLNDASQSVIGQKNPYRFIDAGKPVATKDGTEYFLPDVAQLFFRIHSGTKLAMNKARTLDFARGLIPMYGTSPTGYITEHNEHGAVSMETRKDRILSLTQLYSNGAIWSINAEAIEKGSLIEFFKKEYNSLLNHGYFPMAKIERIFDFTLKTYRDFAINTLKLQFPLRFIAGVTGVKGYKMPNTSYGGCVFEGEVKVENIVYEDGIIRDTSENPTQLLRHFYEKIWDECGLSRPSSR